MPSHHKPVRVLTGLIIASLFLPIAAAAQSQGVAAAHSNATQSHASKSNAARPKESAGPDLIKNPRPDVVGYAHLDKQSSAEETAHINEYIVMTVRLELNLIVQYV